MNSEELLEKIERIISEIHNKYVPSTGITIHCKPAFYWKWRKAVWKSATIKHRGLWRAHKQQGLTKLSRNQWIKENY